MADNEYMKTNTILMLLSLLLLASCEDGTGDGGTFTYKLPLGTINKLWQPTSRNFQTKNVKSIDLTNLNNIVVEDAMHVQTIRIPNSDEIKKVRTYSDCVYSGTQVPVNDFYGYFDVTLVSGNPLVCNQFIPMNYFFRGFEENDDELLAIVGGQFR